MAVLDLCCCTWAFSSCGGQGQLFISVHGLLIAVVSLVAEHRLWVSRLQWFQYSGSVIVVNELSYYATCEIFWDQGSNSCPLHWKANSYPLYHQGSPKLILNEETKCRLKKVYNVRVVS